MNPRGTVSAHLDNVIAVAAPKSPPSKVDFDKWCVCCVKEEGGGEEENFEEEPLL